MGNVVVEGLVEYTRGELEKEAANLFRRRVDIPFRAPINVELLLENMSDIRLEPMTGLLNNHGVEGAVCNQLMSRRITVFVDYNIFNGLDDARYNAVVGEELGHIVLHRSQIHQVKSLEDFLELRQHHLWRRIEQDARIFSAAVRMPELLIARHVEQVYAETVASCGYGDPHGVAKLVRNRLAELFVVPVADMSARLLHQPESLSARIISSAESQSETLLPPANSPQRLSQRAFIESD